MDFMGVIFQVSSSNSSCSTRVSLLRPIPNSKLVQTSSMIVLMFLRTSEAGISVSTALLPQLWTTIPSAKKQWASSAVAMS